MTHNGLLWPLMTYAKCRDTLDCTLMCIMIIVALTTILFVCIMYTSQIVPDMPFFYTVFRRFVKIYTFLAWVVWCRCPKMHLCKLLSNRIEQTMQSTRGLHADCLRSGLFNDTHARSSEKPKSEPRMSWQMFYFCASGLKCGPVVPETLNSILRRNPKTHIFKPKFSSNKIRMRGMNDFRMSWTDQSLEETRCDLLAIQIWWRNNCWPKRTNNIRL